MCQKIKQQKESPPSHLVGLHLHTGLVDQLHMRLSKTICWAAKRLHRILGAPTKKSPKFLWQFGCFSKIGGVYPQNGWWKWWKTLLIHGWFGGTIIFGNTQFFVTFLGWLKRDPKSEGFLWPPTFGDLKRSRLESPGESIHPNVLESKKSGGVDITKFEKRRHFKS